MTLPEAFGGIIPPVCTPLTEEFEVDVRSLERLIRFQLDAGVHGLFLLGSSSETPLLTDRQRETVVEVGVKSAAGQVPVIAGVFDASTARAIEHARVAARFGVDAVVLTAPYYYATSQDEIVAHFRAVGEAVDLPIVAYDIPVTVHVKIERATALRLARDGVIVGIKDSSGDEGNFRALVTEARSIPGFAAFTGAERTFDLALSYGASGAVPGLANPDPAAFVRLYAAARAGDHDAVRREQERILGLFALIGAGDPARMGVFASVLGGFKTTLLLREVIATNVVARPLTRFGPEEIDRVRRILLDLDLL